MFAILKVSCLLHPYADRATACILLKSPTHSDLVISFLSVEQQVIKWLSLVYDSHIGIFIRYFILSCVSDPVLQYLFAGLQHRQLATAAAESLQAICSQCCDHMTSHFTTLLQIVQAIDTFDVTNDAVIGLLKGNQILP